MVAFLVYSIDNFGFGGFSPKHSSPSILAVHLRGQLLDSFPWTNKLIDWKPIAQLVPAPPACLLSAFLANHSQLVCAQPEPYFSSVRKRGTLLCHHGLSCRRGQSPWIFFEERDWAPGRDLLWDVSTPCCCSPLSARCPTGPRWPSSGTAVTVQLLTCLLCGF